MIKIFEDVYPDSFSFGALESIKSFKGKLDYAKTHLNRLAAGSSRVVYKVDDEKVLKLAKNKRGVIQNEIEIDFRNYSPLFAEVFDSHPYNLWVEMEYAKKMTPNKFKELTGYEFSDLKYIADYDHYNKQKGGLKIPFFGSDMVEDMLKNEYIKEFYYLISDHGFLSADFLKKDSWGIVLRDGKETPVLVDFGFHENILYKYFSI